MKAMACSVVILAVVAAGTTLALRVLISTSKIKLIFWRSYFVTPLSAGVLWPPTALAVSWSDDLFLTGKLDCALWRHVQRLRTSVVKPQGPELSSITPYAEEQRKEGREQLLKGPVDIRTLDDRSDAVESAMHLVNITMLSDPITYAAWRWNLSKTLVGYFRSSTTQRVYLVPLVYTTSTRSALGWSTFVLERTAFADKLSWSEIITCGERRPHGKLQQNGTQTRLCPRFRDDEVGPKAVVHNVRLVLAAAVLDKVWREPTSSFASAKTMRTASRARLRRRQ